MDAANDRERERLVAELFGGDNLTMALRSRLLRTREVALLFQVSERAVTDWARKGRLPSVRTPGGHRRYPAEQVHALLVETGRVAIAPSPAPAHTPHAPHAHPHARAV